MATCATVGTADVAGLDISDDTNLAVTYPVILTGDTLSFPATSTLYSNLSAAGLYISANGQVATAATTTFTGGLLYTNGSVNDQLTAGNGLTRTTNDFACDTATSGVFGCLTAADWTTFNGKESALTFNYPLTRSVNTISFPATSTLYSNLSVGMLGINTLGAVYSSATTTAGTGLTYTNGVFSVDLGTSIDISAETNLTGGVGLTLTGDDMACDTATSGAFGCLTAADWTTFNAKQATISATYPIILTGATLSFPATSTLYANLNNGGLGVNTVGAVYRYATTTFSSPLVYTNGDVGCPTCGGGAGYPFTSESTWQATSTLLNLKGGVMSTASSTFQLLKAGTLTIPPLGIPAGTFIAVDANGLVIATTSASGANPTGTIGLTVVNGSATTFLRSDGAPALSQAIIPTWTGTHTFSNATYSALFSGGSVGIGTATPLPNLEIVGLDAAPPTTGSAESGGIRIRVPSGTIAALDIGNYTGGAVFYSWLQSRNSANYETNYALNLNPNGGNVGIGMVTPQAKLDVQGTASSTALQISSLLSSGLAVNSTGGVYAAATTTFTSPLTYTASTNAVTLGDLKQYPSFTYSTSTAWTASTTIPLGTAYVAETWNGVQCFTDAGTLNVDFNDGTNKMNMFNASTTVGTITFTTNNTFTAAEKRYVIIGTPATSPTKISCSVSKTLSIN